MDTIVEGQRDRLRAYEIGAESFREGAPRSAIPSWNLELVNCWREGWDDAASQASFFSSTNKHVQ